MKTKLQIFVAYLPYNCMYIDSRNKRRCKLDSMHSNWNLDGMLLILRPLSALQTPMQHPTTGEEIKSPLQWMADEADTFTSVIVGYFDGGLSWHSAKGMREIESAALSLHFDIYGAIEAGWAVEVQG